MNLSPLPIQKFFDSNGAPLVGGKLFTYVSGTSTKQATYTSSTGLSSNTNPVILDYRGECRLWIDPELSYTFVLAPATDTDPPGAPIWTVNDITAAPANSDNAAVDTGSVNNVSLSIPSISSPVAFTRVVFQANHTNTGPMTLQINGGTAHDLVWQNLGAFAGGEVQDNGIYQAVFDGAQWQLQSPALDPTQMRTAAEVAAGVTPVNYAYEPYNAFRYMSSAQIADVQARTLAVDCTTELQSWLDCCIEEKTTGYLPSGSYLISSRLVGGSNIAIEGASRDATLIYFTGATTITSGAMLAFLDESAFSVRNIGFRCTNAVVGNLTTMLQLQDCVYFNCADLTFGGAGASAGTCKLVCLLIDQSASGFVPPRGNGVLRNILGVIEPGDAGASGSYGVYIKGHASQSINSVVLDGEGDIEHFAFGVKLENASNCYVGAWQIRQATDTEIAIVNGSANTICGPNLIPTATTGKGITIDANSIDNTIINPAFNISSGLPSAVISDLGSRTTIIGQGAPGAQTFAGKLPGAWEMSKADGTGPNLEITRTATDTAQGGIHLLLSGESMLSPAWFGIAEGSGISGQDMERFEVGGALREKLDANAQRMLYAPNASPGGSVLANSQLLFYLDESGDNLKILVKYSDGTVKTGTVAVV